MQPDGDFVMGALVVYALDERLHEADHLLETDITTRLVLSGRLVTESLQLVQHEALDLGGGQRRCWTGMPAALLGFRAQVIAIATAAVLGGMGRCHGAVTSHATQQSLQQGIGRAARHGSAATAVLLEAGL